mmetsp:Transcript_67538/g.201883  ORF Transcript_67538/g.201883 Transcript_67538/m.201883 type:complete len:488 (-) Transcript_67538:1682-3145(-)
MGGRDERHARQRQRQRRGIAIARREKLDLKRRVLVAVANDFGDEPRDFSVATQPSGEDARSNRMAAGLQFLFRRLLALELLHVANGVACRAERVAVEGQLRRAVPLTAHLVLAIHIRLDRSKRAVEQHPASCAAVDAIGLECERLLLRAPLRVGHAKVGVIGGGRAELANGKAPVLPVEADVLAHQLRRRRALGLQRVAEPLGRRRDRRERRERSRQRVGERQLFGRRPVMLWHLHLVARVGVVVVPLLTHRLQRTLRGTTALLLRCGRRHRHRKLGDGGNRLGRNGCYGGSDGRCGGDCRCSGGDERYGANDGRGLQLNRRRLSERFHRLSSSASQRLGACDVGRTVWCHGKHRPQLGRRFVNSSLVHTIGIVAAHRTHLVVIAHRRRIWRRHARQQALAKLRASEVEATHAGDNHRHRVHLQPRVQEDLHLANLRVRLHAADHDGLLLVLPGQLEPLHRGVHLLVRQLADEHLVRPRLLQLLRHL